jgi:hypothetical protein
MIAGTLALNSLDALSEECWKEPLTPNARMVHERDAQYRFQDGHAHYEAESADRRAIGSVSVTSAVQWEASVVVPSPDANVIFFQVERHGPLPEGYQGSQETIDLSLPIGEVDALLALLTGIVAHARRDGVFPSVAVDQ